MGYTGVATFNGVPDVPIALLVIGLCFIWREVAGPKLPPQQG